MSRAERRSRSKVDNAEGNFGAYDLYVNVSGATVPAQHNWWGTTNNATINNRIFDFNDDFIKATATYAPVLTGPAQDAPAYVRKVTILPDTTLGIQTGTFEAQFSRSMDTSVSPQMNLLAATGLAWTTRASMPAARSFLGVAAANGNLYAVGGINARYLASVEEYDPTTNLGRRAPACHGARRPG